MTSGIMGVDEVLQLRSQLIVGRVEVAFDGCVRHGAIHSFHLPIGPWIGLELALGRSFAFDLELTRFGGHP